MRELLNNDYFVWCGMAVIIFLVTQILKLPIKYGTKKRIHNERARKIANSIILLIPFALGVALDILYCKFYTHTAFSIITGLGYGTAGISLYSIIERTFKVKIENPYDTAEGKAVTDLIDNITKDKKIDSSDTDAIKDYLKLVK